MKTKFKKTTIAISGTLKRRLRIRTQGSRRLAREFLSVAVALAIRHFSGGCKDSQVEYQSDGQSMELLHIALSEPE